MNIGITGGIGSGKSTVTNFILEQGYTVIDCDKIAREIVEPGKPALEALVRAFGKEILCQDGSLNRKGLANIVFSNKEKLATMNDIMFTEIVATVKRELKMAAERGEHLIFVDAPVLYEAGLADSVDEVWLVHTEEEVRIARVMERDGATLEEVKARMANQLSEEERMKRANRILNNNGTVEELKESVKRAMASVISL